MILNAHSWETPYCAHTYTCFKIVPLLVGVVGACTHACTDGSILRVCRGWVGVIDCIVIVSSRVLESGFEFKRPNGQSWICKAISVNLHLMYSKDRQNMPTYTVTSGNST